MKTLKGKFNTDCKIFIDDVELNAIAMIQSILNEPATEGVPIRIMPDVHAGVGIVVGFTMPLTTKLKPEWVGVDIGCGMMSGKFSRQTSIDLEKVDKLIRSNVPMGLNLLESPHIKELPFEDIQLLALDFTEKFNAKFNADYICPILNDKWLNDKLRLIRFDKAKFYKSIGTLGGGNHFIEIGVDDNTDYWCTVHTGSRNFGNKIAEHWMRYMKKIPVKMPIEYHNKKEDILNNTIPKDNIKPKLKELKSQYAEYKVNSYLEDEYLYLYLIDVIVAQQFADLNRQMIFKQLSKVLKIKKFDDIVTSTHNYIDFKDFIIRKGAISAYDDELVIIPWNMRDGLIIAKGKSNKDWNNSAPHGAGRLFSRGKAKELVDLKDFQRTMKGIYSTSIKTSTIDESPFAYKNFKTIEAEIEPTVDILFNVKPILNIKDAGVSESWAERKKKDKARKLDRKNNRNAKY